MSYENDDLFWHDVGEYKSKKVTEYVPVPSSDHVAEIVGRQGHRIKAIRAKTNTHISTPARGAEPVFVVTGKAQDVIAARTEILSAAEYFSVIRAQRADNLRAILSPNIQGETTIRIKVPFCVVGLVVGFKGDTIRRIQSLTDTRIVTPIRDTDSVFHITGLPENVEVAKIFMLNHIAVRTNGFVDALLDEYNARPERIMEAINILNVSFLKKYLRSNFIYTYSCDNNNVFDLHTQKNNFGFPLCNKKQNDTVSYFPSGFGVYDTDGISIVPSSFPHIKTPYETTHFGHDSVSRYPDLGMSTNTTSSAVPLFTGLRPINDDSFGLPFLPQQSNGINGSPSGLVGAPARRSVSDPLTPKIGDIRNLGSFNLGVTFPSLESTLTNSTVPASLAINTAATNFSGSSISSPIESFASDTMFIKVGCAVCYENPIVDTFVPCGHNLFCMECAIRICEGEECPICSQASNETVRICLQK